MTWRPKLGFTIASGGASLIAGFVSEGSTTLIVIPSSPSVAASRPGKATTPLVDVAPEDNLGSALGETRGNGLADAAGGSSHQRNPSGVCFRIDGCHRLLLLVVA